MAKVHLRRVTRQQILDDLRKFENRYGMSSAEFYEKFSRGEMGDSEDVIEWAGTYEWVLRSQGKSSRR